MTDDRRIPEHPDELTDEQLDGVAGSGLLGSAKKVTRKAARTAKTAAKTAKRFLHDDVGEPAVDIGKDAADWTADNVVEPVVDAIKDLDG